MTEVITHMIVNQLGRVKHKHIMDRDGYKKWEFVDEELEELRSLGYRFSEFRDHPINKRKKKKQGKKSPQEEEVEE